MGYWLVEINEQDRKNSLYKLPCIVSVLSTAFPIEERLRQIPKRDARTLVVSKMADNVVFSIAVEQHLNHLRKDLTII